MKINDWRAKLNCLSIKWKIFLLSASVFGLSLTAGFAYFTFQSYWLTVTTSLNGLMNFADAKQQGVIRFIDQNEKLARQLAHLTATINDDSVRSQFSEIVGSDVFRLEDHPFKDEIIAGTRNIPTFRVYHSIDYVVGGKILLSSDPHREGAVWNRHIDLTSGYSDPWLDGETPVMTFAAQTSRGTVYVHADARMLTNIVSGEIGNLAGDMGAYYLAGVGKSFDYYIVNKENLLITESRVQKGQFLHGQGSDTPWHTTMQQAGVICGKNGQYLTNAKCTTGCRETMGEYVGRNGKVMLGASMPFYDSNWTLVVEQEKTELLWPMWGMFIEQMLMLIVLGVFSTVLYLRLQNRTLIHPLERLQKAIEDIEHTQDFSKQIEIDSKDEFGILARAFNRMSHSLDSLYQHLENRVADRTHELMTLNEQIRGNLLVSQEMQETLKKSEHQTKKALMELGLQKMAMDEHAIVSITDVSGKIVYFNDRFVKISQYEVEELIGQNHRILNSGYHSKQFWREMYRTIAAGNTWHNEVCNRAKDSSLYWLDMTVVPFMDEHGKPYQYIAIRTDITTRKQSEQEVQKLAYFDPLTHLPNRRLLMDRLHQSFLRGLRKSRHGAVLFIDMDNFKILNDTRGHAVGDQMLVEVAQRLKDCVREEDTVARLGGDEFVILLDNLSTEHAGASTEAMRVAEKIKKELSLPYLLSEKKHHSSPSIGITLYCDSSFSVDELLKHADSAMYEAKRAGRNAIRFYDPTTQAALIVRGEIERELYDALEHHQFELYYQVQVKEDRSVMGAEALIRWLHPEKGMIPPNQFIPMAEDNGMILPIGEWVLEESCHQLKRWQADPLFGELVLAVNISIRQLREPDFVTKLRALIERTAINPARLKLEITESMLINDTQSVVGIMRELKSYGVQFSLDDFGTGYSSLSYIKELPLDQIKIDQSFVRDLCQDASSRVLVRIIISMAESMGVEVIAEGVESEEQCQLLVVKGCRVWQGYLFGKPMPVSEFEVLARNFHHALSAQN